MGKKKAVIDTNVIVSGLLFYGKPGRMLIMAASGKLDSISCRQLMDELSDTLACRKFNLSNEEVISLVNRVYAISHILQVDEPIPIISEDPDDDIVLECARIAMADHIITGDNHLLKIGKHHLTTILTPSQFLAIEER